MFKLEEWLRTVTQLSKQLLKNFLKINESTFYCLPLISVIKGDLTFNLQDSFHQHPWVCWSSHQSWTCILGFVKELC